MSPQGSELLGQIAIDGDRMRGQLERIEALVLELQSRLTLRDERDKQIRDLLDRALTSCEEYDNLDAATDRIREAIRFLETTAP